MFQHCLNEEFGVGLSSVKHAQFQQGSEDQEFYVVTQDDKSCCSDKAFFQKEASADSIVSLLHHY